METNKSVYGKELMVGLWKMNCLNVLERIVFVFSWCWDRNKEQSIQEYLFKIVCYMNCQSVAEA